MREEVYAALIKRFNIKVDYGDEVIQIHAAKMIYLGMNFILIIPRSVSL